MYLKFRNLNHYQNSCSYKGELHVEIQSPHTHTHTHTQSKVMELSKKIAFRVNGKRVLLKHRRLTVDR